MRKEQERRCKKRRLEQDALDARYRCAVEETARRAALRELREARARLERRAAIAARVAYEHNRMAEADRLDPNAVLELFQ